MDLWRYSAEVRRGGRPVFQRRHAQDNTLHCSAAERAGCRGAMACIRNVARAGDRRAGRLTMVLMVVMPYGRLAVVPCLRHR
jgi:hypothetical protein